MLRTPFRKLKEAGTRTLIALVATLVVGLACGEDPTATPEPTVAPTVTPAAAPAAVASATPTPSAAATTVAQSTPAPTQQGATATPEPTATPAPTSPPVLPTPAPTVPATPIPTPSHFPVTVIDSNGEDVVFDEAPRKIVALDSAVVEFLYAMGEEDRLVAIHDFLSYPTEALSLPSVGSSFQVNAEKILELDPDLITVFFAGAVDTVSGLGVPVLYIETPVDLNGIPEQIRMWGRILDNSEAAERVVDDFESRLAAIIQKLEGIEEGPRYFHDDSLFYTSGPDTFVGSAYTLLKAKNIAHDMPNPYGQLSPEVIVERDPEVIVATFPDIPQEYLDNPAFENVSAVKNDRIVVVEPDGILSVAGTRFLEGLEWLAAVLHPNVFQGEADSDSY